MQRNEEPSPLYCPVGSQASFSVRGDPVLQVKGVNQVYRKLLKRKT